MKDPVLDLAAGHPFDSGIREKISFYYRARGKKALDIVDQNRVRRYRDFFIVIGDTARYVVEEEFCSCGDFLHRGGTCAHILAVKIARATGRYDLVDQWYYEEMQAQNRDNQAIF